MKTIAVIDIGKTNAKVALVDLERFEETAMRRTANVVQTDGLYPHFDVERLHRFIVESLADLSRTTPIEAISVTAHGATCVLVGADGELAMPVLDYEHPGPDTLAAEYDKVRPPFAETGAARLPGGLNIGAQIYWQEHTFPEEFSKVTTILTYPQYWTFRLTGVLANELTSLGCHTDVWNPYKADFSTMVDARGWRKLFAPVCKAGDRFGLSAEVAQAVGLSEGLPVYCGIHDSNASLLPHILTRSKPFSVASTGTWVVIMAMGAAPAELDEQRDTLVNVNALGDAVPSARFMGGRTVAALVPDPSIAVPDAVEAAMAEQLAMLLPSVPRGSGPFPNAVARWTCEEETLSPAEKLAVVSFHLALMTAVSLDLIGARGETIIEGPLAANRSYLRMLKAATGRPVFSGGQGATGTSLGAACLVEGVRSIVHASKMADDIPESYRVYAQQWRAAAGAV